MKQLMSKIITKVLGRNYIHIPKNQKALNICKKILDVKRVRGRGRNWKAIVKDINDLDNKYLLRRIGQDGDVPHKYASYYYLKLV